MLRTFDVNQEVLIKYSLRIEHYLLLQALRSFASSNACVVMVQEEALEIRKYYLFNHMLIPELLPCLCMDKDGNIKMDKNGKPKMSRQNFKSKMNKLQDLGLIAPHENNQQLQRSYYRFTSVVDEMFNLDSLSDIALGKQREVAPRVFVKPSQKEVIEYFKEKVSTETEALKFYAFYDDYDWTKGTRGGKRVAIKNWKNMVTMWLNNVKEWSKDKAKKDDEDYQVPAAPVFTRAQDQRYLEWIRWHKAHIQDQKKVSFTKGEFYDLWYGKTYNLLFNKFSKEDYLAAIRQYLSSGKEFNYLQLRNLLIHRSTKKATYVKVK